MLVRALGLPVRRLHGMEKIRGSIPLGSTSTSVNTRASSIVVLRLIRIEEIGGSIPLWSTIRFNDRRSELCSFPADPLFKYCQWVYRNPSVSDFQMQMRPR
ncbi:MAG: hypothetical protein UW78_C0017G0016 [Candidatus Azambacteria bacterium GW2011_GWA1_44_9]|uniref:Uncharacterized protein n=1 Tax=Candidatus Azambacteria bacterium GW2011_GWA1_44_9 TaxID=1618610 RepID=A0A0G1KC38_9BACT|nr:MAG: hypothetical protein UW78_C0017G0016 [Candidatus Azambacteria bacterium GW2011_GWA1_44_9]